MTYVIIFWLLYYPILFYQVICTLTIADKGISPLQKNSIAIQFFIDTTNKNSFGVCKVYSKIKKCCLVDAEVCDLVNVYSPQVKTVKARGSKRLIFIFPSIYQHDLIGYCDIALIYRCTRKAGILNVHLPFDTKIDVKSRSNSVFKDYTNVDKTSVCQTLDQDSLNKCSPIDCDVKYNGKKPFYDKSLSKCIETPICIASLNDDLPNMAYDSQLNICKDLDVQLSVQDIYTITTGLGVVTKKNIEKENISKMVVKSNCSTISQNLLLLKDLMCGKLCPCPYVVDFTDLCMNAVFCIIFSIVSISVAILCCVCCIHTSVWLFTQWLDGNMKDLMMNIRSKIKRTNNTCRYRSEAIDPKQNILLREIVTKEIPLEIRNSAVSVCERLEKEIYTKNKYKNPTFDSRKKNTRRIHY